MSAVKNKFENLSPHCSNSLACFDSSRFGSVVYVCVWGKTSRGLPATTKSTSERTQWDRQGMFGRPIGIAT